MKFVYTLCWGHSQVFKLMEVQCGLSTPKLTSVNIHCMHFVPWHRIALKLYLIYEFIHIYLSSNEPWSNIFYNTRTSRKLNSLVLWFCLRDVDSYRSNCWLQSWKPELNSLTRDAYVRWKLLNKSLFVVNLNPRDENSFRYTHTAWALRTPSRVCWHSINVFVKYQIYGEYSLN